MLTIQMVRKNLLSKVRSSIFALSVAGLAIAAPFVAKASQCEDLFQPAAPRAVRPKPTAAEYLAQVAEFESAAAFAQTIAAGRRSDEAQLYTQLIAPGLWSFARLKVLNEAIVEMPVDPGVTNWLGKIQREALSQVQRNHQDSRRNERPRVMTADERIGSVLTGNYDMVDRPLRPLTAAQQKQAAFRDMLAQAEAQMKRGQPKGDPVMETYAFLVKNAGGQEFLAKTHIDRLLESPVDFAITYAQMNGLIHYAGDAGLMLSPHIPWLRRVDNASANSLRAIGSMARAMAIENPDFVRATDNLVLEILQREFAPHLGFKFDVGRR